MKKILLKYYLDCNSNYYDTKRGKFNTWTESDKKTTDSISLEKN